MPKSKSQKKEILANLEEKLRQMKSAVFVNFSGIPVKEIDDLRNKCKEEGVEYIVSKKTLLKKALVDNGFKDANNYGFDGEVATTFGFTDEVAPARLIKKFSKSNENMKIVSGILEGVFIDATKVVALSKLPSRDELIAKVVGSIAAPLSGMVNVLQGNIRNFVYVLSAIRDKKL